MAKEKKAFLIYTSWNSFLEDLNYEQKGMWLEWVMAYCNDLNPEYPNDSLAKIACKMVQDILKRDLDKYEAKVERVNKLNQERRKKNEIVTESLQSRDEIVGDKDKVKDKEKDIKKENILKEKKDDSSVPQSETDSVFPSFSTKILSFWNELGIIQHTMTQKISDAIIKKKKEIRSLNKEFTDDDIFAAMTSNFIRYNKCIKDNTYFFSTRWTLVQYLTQRNAYNDFEPQGSKWLNYMDSPNSRKALNQDIMNEIKIFEEGQGAF